MSTLKGKVLVSRKVVTCGQRELTLLTIMMSELNWLSVLSQLSELIAKVKDVS